MVELYTMQRYLQYNTLLKHNLQHFDSWASTFGETVTAVELLPEGNKFKLKTSFSRFYNVPELMNMFREVADIQTAETLNLPVPKLEKHIIEVEPSEIQKQMVQALGERAELIRSGQVSVYEDNMLNITNEGRKLALDQRIINSMLPDEKESKVNACIKYVYDTWKKTADEKLTQLIFCDLSVPNKSSNIVMKENEDGVYEVDKEQSAEQTEETPEEIAEDENIFTDVYNDIKKKLIEMGVPEEEIAFIHDATTETKKEELFAKVRTGEIRILLGSTFKMGAGTNVQDLGIAYHDLDCPFRPGDLTQRGGRFVRQGNKNPVVHQYVYVTKGTFDAYMYQMVEKKQRGISQIMTSKTPERSIEDIDEKALGFAEIKSIATGDPLIIEKTDLETKSLKLKMLKQSYLDQKYELEDMINKKYPREIAECEKEIANLTEDNEYLKANTTNLDFCPMQIENQIYKEKVKAGEKILELCKKVNDTKGIYIGTYRGFKMYLEFNPLAKVFQVALQNKQTYRAILGTDKLGIITRINNTLEAIIKSIPTTQDKLQNLQQQLKTAQENLSIPFAKEQELQETLKRLQYVNSKLKIGEISKNEIIEVDDDEIEVEDYEKQRKREYVR